MTQATKDDANSTLSATAPAEGSSTSTAIPISAFGTGNMMHGDKSKAMAATRGARGGGRGGRGRGRGRGRGAAQSSSRKPKIQNTHLQGIDLSKDYV